MKKEDIINNLSRFDPPEMVWENIENELDKNTKIWPVWYYAVAASVATLLIGGWWFFQNPTESITYSQEKLVTTQLAPEDAESEKQYAQIVAVCAEKVALCEKPEFKKLKQELDQLNSAHQQLKKVIGNYAPDSVLVVQLAEIEVERSLLLKKMVEKI